MRGVVRVGPFSRLRPVVKRAARKRTVPVTSYHCQIKIISRSNGRSATAAAAYRAGERIVCDREGRTYDYTRKAGVEDAFIRTPASVPAWALDREQLWNAAEAAENRRNSRVAREWEIALPHELDADERRELADGYAQALVERYGAAVDVCIHAPHRSGDQRNYHAHILVTTRKIGADGFGAKTRVLDDKKTGPGEIEATRVLWAEMQNDRLARANIDARVDHRSLEGQRMDAMARGDEYAAAALDRPAEKHMGPEISTIERRAEKRAANEGKKYEPVTECGQQVHVVRQIRALLDRLLVMKDALGGRLQQAKNALSKLRGADGDKNQSNTLSGRKNQSISGIYDLPNPSAEKTARSRNVADTSRRTIREFTSPALEPLPPGIAELKQEQAREQLRQIREEQKKDRPDRPRERGKDWER